ncbi:hypothetical protein KBC70_02820 [Candidatus Woesebacteria bacterium]|jgi:hypothetical protein|nr:hypothetical protein [Candidatus Woesebacteria bacterium]
MSEKALVMLCFTVGSVIGGYAPLLFGAGAFSVWAVLGGAVGGIVGIYAGYKLAGF